LAYTAYTNTIATVSFQRRIWAAKINRSAWPLFRAKSTRTAVRTGDYLLNDVGCLGRQGVGPPHPNPRTDRTVSAVPETEHGKPASKEVAVSATATGSGATKAERQRGLLLALLLAGLAGMVDAIGYIRLGHLFVSYMSGNSTQFAIAVGRARFAEAGQIMVLIALFVIGAAAGQVLAHLTGYRHLTAVLVVVVLLLTVSALFDTAPLPMVVAMGALNAAMHRAGNVRVHLTYITGTLVKFGEGLGDFLTGRAKGWDWVEQATPWLGIVGGAVLAGAAQQRIGAAVDWIPVALAIALCLSSLFTPAPE
jgi:uncharacterized membrane protein YoaK (UPF0700 family)